MAPPVDAAQKAELKTLAATKWQTLPAEEVFRIVGSRATGLTSAEVEASRAKYGPNTTPSPPKPGILAKIWAQLNNMLIFILLGSAVIAGIFQDWGDLALILAVVVLNVVIGVIQEGKAESAAEALQSMLAAKSMVIRDGQQRMVPCEEIVVGDVLYLQAGDAVGADIRFFAVASIRCLESALTGEAEPVDKDLELHPADKGIGDWKNCGFAGTSCVSGQGSGVVIGVGPASQIGAIQTMIDSTTQTETPLHRALEVFGRVLSILCLIVAIISFVIAYVARDYELSVAFEMAVGIAVALIPEGLPSVVTITLAIGVRKMAAHNAIIRQLPAVETLGSVSIVCSDKTGTLTLNQMQVTKIRTRQQQFSVDGVGYDPYSGDIQGAEGSVRKTAPDLLTKLYWLTLPGVIANDGGLVAPNALVARWPSQRAGAGGAASPAGTVAPPPAAIGGATATSSVAETDHAIVPIGAGEAAAAAAVTKVGSETAEGAGGIPAGWEISGDPTDVAVLVLGHKAGIDGNINSFKSSFPTVAKVPFDSDYKFVAVMQDIDTPAGRKRLVYLKGAWDVLIQRCATQAVDNDAFRSERCDQAWWREQASAYAANGMRVLAVAQWEVPATKSTLALSELLEDAATSPTLQINCLLAILDPCRESAGRAVAECKAAGITVKMITGDHADTACFIARELGIIDNDTFQRYLAVKDTDPEARKRIVLQGSEIEAIPKDPEGTKVPAEPELAKYVLDVNVYARVSPEHKLRIVRALKNTHNRITSMTGDGVNDAPALKEAHVGVAMGITGTDVAKQAAKMILADDLFATIAEAVRRGRGVYDNLRKVLMFALPTNFAQGFSIVMAIIIGMQSPLTAIQVLTVNMITSVTLGVVLALEEPESDVMSRPPRDPKAPLLDAYIAWRTFYVTVLLVVAMLGIEQWELVVSGDLFKARACAMSVLVISQCLYTFSCRYVNHTALHYRVLMGNPWLVGAVVFNAAVQVFLVYCPGVNTVWSMAPIDGLRWLRILGLAILIFLIVELEKWAGPRFLVPVFGPCLRRFGACWVACGNAVFRRCSGFWCNLFFPANSPVMTGMPTSRAKMGTAALRNARSGKSVAEVQEEATVDAETKRTAVSRTFSRTGTHHHVPPTKPVVSKYIAASKRRIDYNNFSTPSTRALAGVHPTASSAAGAGVSGRVVNGIPAHIPVPQQETRAPITAVIASPEAEAITPYSASSGKSPRGAAGGAPAAAPAAAAPGGAVTRAPSLPITVAAPATPGAGAAHADEDAAPVELSGVTVVPVADVAPADGPGAYRRAESAKLL